MTQRPNESWQALPLTHLGQFQTFTPRAQSTEKIQTRQPTPGLVNSWITPSHQQSILKRIANAFQEEITVIFAPVFS
jgi:hypothetical protein